MADAFSRAVVDGRGQEWRAFLAPGVHISCIQGHSDPAHPICKHPPLDSFHVVGVEGGYRETASVSVRFVGGYYEQTAALQCRMVTGHWRIAWVNIMPGE